MKRTAIRVLVMLGGLALAGAGLWIVKAGGAEAGIMRTLPFLCIGVGCGMFGGALGELISAATMKKHPDVFRQAEIEAKDERNVAIANRAKAKAYEAMLYIFGALMIAFALMEVDVAVILLLVFAYLVVVGYMVYWLTRYQKEM